MKFSTEKIILASDPCAAEMRMEPVWYDNKGHAFIDEHSARWSSSTHRKCECGEITEKHYTKCRKCRDKKDAERFYSMPRKEWDGTSMLVTFDGDRCFENPEDAQDYADDNDCTMKDLMLVICEPTRYHEIEPDEIYQDILPEDGEVDVEIRNAFVELNRKIKDCVDPASWFQGKFALLVEE